MSMINKKSLFLFLAIVTILFASPLASGIAFADDTNSHGSHSDDQGGHWHNTFASFCATINDRNSFEALVCTAIADLETRIHNISLTPGPQGPAGATGPAGPPGSGRTVTYYLVTGPIGHISEASCNPGDFLTGGGALASNVVAGSYPLSTSTWFAIADTGGSVVATAICEHTQ